MFLLFAYLFGSLYNELFTTDMVNYIYLSKCIWCSDILKLFPFHGVQD